MYRVSRYNNFQPWDQNTHLAYNAATGAVALMTGDNLAMYERIAAKLESGDEVSLDEREQELLTQLIHGGFVLPSSYTEIEQHKFTHRRHRFDESTMGLVIAPTMACNMACQYCFEANKKGRMSAAVIEDVIGFVESKATQLRLMDVSWYGGEPLLAMDIIEDLTESFLDLADKYSFKYAASMISNGYLLTKETADHLRDLHVSSVQITLDGPSRIHDTKRPLKNGRSSFATIVKNIGYACDVLDISVRVNVDRTTTDDVVSELLQELDSAGLRRKVAINFGKIEPATSACADIAESCYENADFAEVETKFYGMLLDHGFWVGKLPQPAATVCMAQQINSFLIDHEGYIYKCFNYVGDSDRAMGRIADDIDFSHPNFTDLFRFDPFDDSSCRECSLLPICLGGCPARRAEGFKHMEQLCDSWKYNLRPMLEIVARARQRQMQSATQEAL